MEKFETKDYNKFNLKENITYSFIIEKYQEVIEDESWIYRSWNHGNTNVQNPDKTRT